MGRIAAEISAARAAIAEREVQKSQIEQDFRSQVLGDLQTVGQQIAELLQQKVAAEDRLQRLEIRAPQSGVIHESKVQTVGGVVAAGETIMLVVPQEQELEVDARVSPMDIDKIRVGQHVMLRLTSLDTRRTPELNANVSAVSPDLTRDAMTGAPFFSFKIAVRQDELDSLPRGVKLVPGMPAEAFAQTAERTVLAYLLNPITEQMAMVFRED